jgi:hypothetical protein
MRLIKKQTYYEKPWYNTYRCMKSRCYREKDPSYKYYGGRGIKVCEEWLNIRNFEKWVEQNPYFEGATIDRIDCDGDYSPENCRWATMYEQDNNRRNTIMIEWKGECHSLSDWSQIIGINKSTLKNRYWRGDRGDRLFEKVRYKRNGTKH